VTSGTGTKRVADAARRLNELREAWLNPPDLVVRVPRVTTGSISPAEMRNAADPIFLGRSGIVPVSPAGLHGMGGGETAALVVGQQPREQDPVAVELRSGRASGR
jgi:hypothetical protein